MGIVHISQMDPEEHFGGVARFARDLKLALPELKFLHHGVPEQPWSAAPVINEGFLKEGEISVEDTVIADGYYGLGLTGKVERLINVCHSTYAGWVRDWDLNPPPSYKKMVGWFETASKYQERAYEEADQLVAVSTSAAEELEIFYQFDPITVILLAIDPDRYIEAYHHPGRIVEAAAGDENKGADIVAQLCLDGTAIAPLGFDGPHEERWRREFEIALLPSRHEAGSYVALEAMATNLKIVTSYSGFFKHDIPKDRFWGTHDLYHGTFKRLISEAREAESPNLRKWVIENAHIDLFKKRWREFLHGREE